MPAFRSAVKMAFCTASCESVGKTEMFWKLTLAAESGPARETICCTNSRATSAMDGGMSVWITWIACAGASRGSIRQSTTSRPCLNAVLSMNWKCDVVLIELKIRGFGNQGNVPCTFGCGSVAGEGTLSRRGQRAPVLTPARDGQRMLAPQSRWGRSARKVLAAWLALAPFMFGRTHHRAVTKDKRQPGSKYQPFCSGPVQLRCC